MQEGNVIEVRDVYKNFGDHVKGVSLKEVVVNHRHVKRKPREVLHGVTFSVRGGEALGIIGRNGSGKSTILKLLTRILNPNRGAVETKGKMSCLIELGAGFHPDMTGRENVYINASIFGMGKEEVDRKFDDIWEFSEIGDHIDERVRNYSSGMYMRLAFAVAINVNADILVVDEILAVGDIAFQEKCLKEIKRLKENGVTIVIVTHSVEMVRDLCDRAIWLNEGVIERMGDPGEVCDAYVDYMSGDLDTIQRFCVKTMGHNMTTKKRITIIPPDSAGSKGDEALVRGAVSVFGDAELTLLTTDRHDLSWKTELMDICSAFDEIIVPFSRISDYIEPGTTLVVLGADSMDGTCGTIPTNSRLDAMSRCLETGGEVIVFSSFRSDVNLKIIDKIEEIFAQEGSINWYMRDTDSQVNFRRQTGLDCGFFPDFAFFCPEIEDVGSHDVIDSISRARESGRFVVGVNFSIHSFDSFYFERTEANIESYVDSVVRTIKDTIPGAYLVFITHDVRRWDTMPNDWDFAYRAYCQVGPSDGFLLNPNLSFPEIMAIIPSLDIVVSGRMHLAISSFRSGVVPVLAMGDGSTGTYTAIDKNRGMFRDRMGTGDLVVSDKNSLSRALTKVRDNRESLREIIIRNEERNRNLEILAMEEMRSGLGLSTPSPIEVSCEDRAFAIREAMRGSVRELRDVSEQGNRRAEFMELQIQELRKEVWNLRRRMEKDRWVELSYEMDRLIDGKYEMMDKPAIRTHGNYQIFKQTVKEEGWRSAAKKTWWYLGNSIKRGNRHVRD